MIIIRIIICEQIRTVIVRELRRRSSRTIQKAEKHPELSISSTPDVVKAKYTFGSFTKILTRPFTLAVQICSTPRPCQVSQ